MPSSCAWVRLAFGGGSWCRDAWSQGQPVLGLVRAAVPCVGPCVCAVRADRVGRKGGDTQCVVWASAQGRIVRPGPRVPGVRWTALEVRGVQWESSVTRGSAWVQDFGALSLVTPSNPVRLQSGLVWLASVRWACGLVRVARHQGYLARIAASAIPGGGRVTSNVGLPGQTCGALAPAADLWPGGARGRMPKHGQWSAGAGLW